MKTTAPKRIWINVPYGRDPDDWWFTDMSGVAKDMVAYVPASECDKRDAEIERLREAVQERDGVIERVLLRELRLREDKERLMDRIDGCHQSMREKDAEIERLWALFSHWYEMWNDGIPNPDGDVLDDTVAALAGKEDV